MCCVFTIRGRPHARSSPLLTYKLMQVRRKRRCAAAAPFRLPALGCNSQLWVGDSGMCHTSFLIRSRGRTTASGMDVEVG